MMRAEPGELSEVRAMRDEVSLDLDLMLSMPQSQFMMRGMSIRDGLIRSLSLQSSLNGSSEIQVTTYTPRTLEESELKPVMQQGITHLDLTKLIVFEVVGQPPILQVATKQFFQRLKQYPKLQFVKVSCDRLQSLLDLCGLDATSREVTVQLTGVNDGNVDQVVVLIDRIQNLKRLELQTHLSTSSIIRLLERIESTYKFPMLVDIRVTDKIQMSFTGREWNGFEHILSRSSCIRSLELPASYGYVRAVRATFMANVVSNCPGFHHVKFHVDDSWHDLSADHIRAMKGLSCLELVARNPWDLETIKQVGLTNVKSLDAKEVPPWLPGRLPGLLKFRLDVFKMCAFAEEVQKGGLHLLNELKQLQVLTIDYGRGLCSQRQVLKEILRQVVDMRNLRSLTFEHLDLNQVQEQDLEHLSKYSHLHEFEISKFNGVLEDSHLKMISKCACLRSVILQGNKTIRMNNGKGGVHVRGRFNASNTQLLNNMPNLDTISLGVVVDDKERLLKQLLGLEKFERMDMVVCEGFDLQKAGMGSLEELTGTKMRQLRVVSEHQYYQWFFGGRNGSSK
eukprot:TRINITY_DN4174_c0_g1_i1.p1 TRINITY_DN4174_c0_g1~~TRINITY_DN4174_c0_g1_i1.p1  ORF type:complete len:565 (-),score=69.93 TRINITY_DN4174_c0_g1_i1:2937-4631(-)